VGSVRSSSGSAGRSLQAHLTEAAAMRGAFRQGPGLRWHLRPSWHERLYRSEVYRSEVKVDSSCNLLFSFRVRPTVTGGFCFCVGLFDTREDE
jgi:hypothetical protein